MITPNKTNLYKRIATSFLVLSLLIGLTIFYVAFSWATITITPKAENFSAQYAMDVVDTSQNPVANNVIPGSIKETDLDGTGTFAATGTENVEQKQGGKITVVNTTGKDQPLRATTRFLTEDGTLFRTQDYVMVPAKGQADVEIYADQPGAISGKISSRFTIPGLWEGLQTQIYGQGYVPLQDGVGKNKLVTQDDLDKAQEKLVSRLEQSFLDNLQKDPLYQKSSGQVSQVVSHKIIKSTASKKVGDKTEQFDIKVSVHFTAVLFNEQILKTQLKTKLSERLGPNQELLNPKDGQIRYALTRVSSDKKSATLTVSATAGRILKQDTRVVEKERLTGLSSDEVKAHFASQVDIQGIEVQMYPFWITRTPLIADHINILVKR